MQKNELGKGSWLFCLSFVYGVCTNCRCLFALLQVVIGWLCSVVVTLHYENILIQI